jgi:uncharacterized protein (DUF1501 family)
LERHLLRVPRSRIEAVDHREFGSSPHEFRPPGTPRRAVLRAGAAGMLGIPALTQHHPAWAAEPVNRASPSSGNAVIYVFLSGGLSQLESFDMKPDAPADIRGEFRPIATKIPGLTICEHLPLLAQRSEMWSVVRSLSHGSNDHSAGHHIMLTGRSDLPSGFDPTRPRGADWPSMAAVAGTLTKPRNNLPAAVVLPEKLIHVTGRVIPGQFAGEMGSRRDPWFVEAAPFDPNAYGAFPAYEFDHQDRPQQPKTKKFRTPELAGAETPSNERLMTRRRLLDLVDRQGRGVHASALDLRFDRDQRAALAMLTDRTLQSAFNVLDAPGEIQDRYGRHAFGWSLLMARRLVEAGVNFVQVNLGNNETWDTHGNMFPHLKDKLLPPTDQALAALLDDLHATGLLERTLVVVAGEFGRTPRISRLPKAYKLPGRDHWGPVQSVLLAGGGVVGGRAIGSTDKIAAYPRSEPQTPENLAATIYHALGLPATAAWHDPAGRPHYVYRADPIRGLS